MDDKWERILDEGIAGYVSAEPLAGMEERIIAKIRVAQRPQRRLKGWGVALAVGVAGLSVIVLLPPPTEELRAPVPAAVVIPPRLSVPQQGVRVSRMLPRRARAKVLPKLAVFPTPSPLTVEEQRLIALVAVDPKGTAEAFESLRKRNEPLEIAPLVIEPLNIDGGQ